MTIAYLFVLLLLGLYSYSQIDLNLTLLSAPWFLSFQHFMIQLGYFNRPVSAAIFLAITSLLMIFYWLLLKRADRITHRDILIILFGLSLLGVFSYPAFSHDIFNYIYSGRIVLVQHASPYLLTPLDFPNDTWTRFMQWTHVTFAWGPGFLLLILPFYLLGLGKFTLTLLAFKLMATLAFLGSAFVISRLAGRHGLILFALNPLIIYEGLIAGHVDIVMLFFALLAVFFWQKRKIVPAWLLLFVSVSIKYATILLAPAFLLKKDWKSAANWLIGLAYLGTLGQIISRELLPHYFIVPFGLTALFPTKKPAVKLLIFLTVLLLLLRYLPFIGTGEWLTVRLNLVQI